MKRKMNRRKSRRIPDVGQFESLDFDDDYGDMSGFHETQVLDGDEDDFDEDRGRFDFDRWRADLAERSSRRERLRRTELKKGILRSHEGRARSIEPEEDENLYDS